ncbi:putative radical SAM protein [Stutzerimonas stutzeri]|nr:putative radical SAM protein [Stutzerimonas stutzeri]
MIGSLKLLPFGFHRLDSDSVVAISAAGDHVYLNQSELENLVHSPESLSLVRRAELQAKFFITRPDAEGTAQLLHARIAAKKETVTSGPTLHVIVPTLQCEHSCRYCQVSRSLEDNGYSMTIEQLNAACDTIFQSPSETLTVEFQGGDPLLRFDLIRYAIDRISTHNDTKRRRIRFVVASTLHHLTPEMCDYFRGREVYLSTSLDGPAELHNMNRPLATRDSYQRTLEGIELARSRIGTNAVSALMTTTSASLVCPDAIVDEYVKHGFTEIFIRPLSLYGFAKRNAKHVSYSHENFTSFYERALERVFYWNRNGVELREGTAALILNKILAPFDAGYVDLQSPSGAGLATLVYNYDGYVYPSDEARMLAETGDRSLRLGEIGEPLHSLMSSPIMHQLVSSSLAVRAPGCAQCAFNPYCGPDPVAAQAQFGSIIVPSRLTEHCARSTWLFEYFLRKLQNADSEFLDMAYAWGMPRSSCDA